MKKLITILSLLINMAFANEVDNIREISQKLNSFTPKFYKNIQLNLDNNIPLHGRELRLMHEVIFHYINLDKRFEKLIQTQTSKTVKALLGLDRYQSFLINIEPFYSTARLRRYLNDEDLSFHIKRYELNDYVMNLLNPSEAKILSQKIDSILSTNTTDQYSMQIAKHSALKFVKNDKKIISLNKLYKDYKKDDLRNDRIVDMTDRVSGRFGNTAGAVRWRKGHLINKTKIHQEILSKLSPLDIITEKTYFALTDKFIPGHFGHNAIWLGTKDELIRLGMWNHKSIIPFQKDIEAEKSILEVDRSGTHLKNLTDFMNVDEFAILRLKELHFTTERLEEIYTVALSQIGKIYDFNFDVETTDKLVCSELLYQSFTNVHWPTQSYLTNTKLKRTTISPDNIVSLALYNDSPIELIYYVAQKKKKQTPIYKDLDQLAVDLEFAKINDEYKRVIKECKEAQTDDKGCEISYEDLPYSAHPFIEGIGI